MVVSINIDETIRKPNVRPPAPRSKRGPITFIAEIQESNGRDLRRNLTRGINIVDDTIDPVPPIVPESISIALQSLILSLNLDATWAKEEISLPSVVMELTSNFGYKIIVDSDVTVELPINDIQINVDADLEALPIDLTNSIEAQADEASLKPLELTLTNEIDSITTEDLEEPLEVVELTLTDGELGYKIIVDSDVTVDLPINDIQIDVSEQLETLPISLNVEEFEIEVGGNINVPGMELTLPAVEIVTTHDEALEPITITLTNEIEVTAEAGDLGVVELELSNRAALDIVQESDVSASLTVLSLVTDQGIATDTVEVELTNEVALGRGINAEALPIELTNAVGINKDLGIDEISIDFSNLILLDTGINIEIPADAQGPDADEATTVTMVA